MAAGSWGAGGAAPLAPRGFDWELVGERGLGERCAETGGCGATGAGLGRALRSLGLEKSGVVVSLGKEGEELDGWSPCNAPAALACRLGDRKAKG